VVVVVVAAASEADSVSSVVRGLTGLMEYLVVIFVCPNQRISEASI
jgi:hypothetical protein